MSQLFEDKTVGQRCRVPTLAEDLLRDVTEMLRKSLEQSDLKLNPLNLRIRNSTINSRTHLESRIGKG